MWSLFFIKHLKLSGVCQGLRFRIGHQETHVTTKLDYELKI